ncbi:unnamed protein product [Adineta steineri]|uniref:Uncharacterized protein n=1 Tax=Adineta steineri TaxID=433720 RepID=A0A815TZ27_9BILA|nr:unnamed protein product [Adineta steineri]CAF1514985.1 unnamed protein product [Adineta steineri]
MHHQSLDTTAISKQTLHNNNHNNEDSIELIGTAKTLQRAMSVCKLSEMLDCIKDMKTYARTIEKDLPDYLHTIHIDNKTEMNITEFKIDDFLQLAKQRFDNNNNQYILLNDLIEQKLKSNESQLQHNQEKSLVDKQVEYMKHVIAAQPSALEAIYLEALLNPDQWQYNHHLLQTSPIDILTSSERKRLDEILNKTYDYKS